jgi:hypothetical protein
MLPGGGTVFFVTEEHHRYLDNLEEREEGGTPDIVGAIRCAVGQRLCLAQYHTLLSPWLPKTRSFTIPRGRWCPRPPL